MGLMGSAQHPTAMKRFMESRETTTIDLPTRPKISKSRKSVAFDEDVLSGDNATPNGEEKSTAERHNSGDGAPAAEVDEAFKAPKKKKKASTKSKDEAPVDGTEELDLSMKKKKKKKSTTTDFDAKLAEAGITADGAEEAAAGPAEPLIPSEAGDPVTGTGVWSESSDATLTYPLLLHRFFVLLRTQHPDLAGDGRLKAYKIPPPQVLREGNRKTIFANLSEICKRMKRHDDHVTQFLFAELGTSGSVDGSKRLVIKGRFQQKQLENVLRRYIVEYVTCRTCKSPNTELEKGESRLYFVTCNSCGSRRSVTAIKIGFQATVGKRRRQQT
ncbi:domain found in IF2B/IF5-domain-containing protein [Peziza echinospora]|nr:domain found in IF2B/IF5-domain-containing protein [Peziza echinospora]